jgi:putative ABC transport system permease protein
MNDWKRAARRLVQRPGFAAVVVLTLAFGIGANATVWCWLDHLVLRPFPGVPRQEELVVLVSNRGGGNVSELDLRDLTGFPDVFAGALFFQTSFASLEVDNQPEWVNTQVVSADYFDVLGVRPRLGRTFLPGEDRKPGGDPVLVISERLWRRRFAADPGVVGRVVELNRHPFTIVGVVPKPFRGAFSALAFDAWAPASMIWEVRNQRLEGRSARGWHPLARLRPGVSLARARAAVEARNAQLTSAYPDTNRDVRHRLVTLSECPYGAQAVMGPVLRLLQTVSLGVLLIVAVNVANLSLASASGRRKEIAIQLSLGASRARLVRLLLAESLLLALAGGLLGVLFAMQARGAAALFLPAAPLGVELDLPPDGSTLAFTLLLTLATGLLFGLVTAVRATRVPLHESLKEGGRSSGGGAHQRLRNGLVVAEMALSLVLLVGAGLCLQGLRQARRIELGLDPDRVLTANLQIGMNGYTPETGLGFYRELRRRLAALPGVEEAALASWFPLGLAGCKGSGVFVEGYLPAPGEDATYEFAIVSPRYFAALRVPLVAGRDFSDADDMGSARVAIVNEAFAARFWPGRDPLGRRFRARGEWRTIVGVTRTGKYNRLDEPPWPFYYLPDQQGVSDLDLSLAVRTTGDPDAVARAVVGAVRGLDPRVEPLRTLPLRSYAEAVFFPQRMASGLLLLLGAVSLALAALGVYGVMAYAVAQRTQEFGVRLALGATPGDVVWLVLRQTLALTAAGVVTGLVLSLAMTRLVAGFLHGVSPFDPVTYVAVPVFLAVVGLLASGLPARRATRVDPVVALRYE